nr:coiled-coil domain-containing protein 81 [Delphinus delphis]
MIGCLFVITFVIRSSNQWSENRALIFGGQVPFAHPDCCRNTGAFYGMGVGHLADRNAELERVSRIYQDLQDDWERSAVLKKQRDLEEKAFQRAPSKLFLLDQCEKYRRCKQCQRRPSNVGKSNVWPLNKYMQGSLLFV